MDMRHLRRLALLLPRGHSLATTQEESVHSSRAFCSSAAGFFSSQSSGRGSQGTRHALLLPRASPLATAQEGSVYPSRACCSSDLSALSTAGSSLGTTQESPPYLVPQARKLAARFASCQNPQQPYTQYRSRGILSNAFTPPQTWAPLTLFARGLASSTACRHLLSTGRLSTAPLCTAENSTATNSTAALSTALNTATHSTAAHSASAQCLAATHSTALQHVAAGCNIRVTQRRSSSMAVQLPSLSGPVKVLFCGDEFPAAYDLSASILHRDPDMTAEWCPRDEVPERIKGCHVVVPRMTRLTRDVLSGAKDLKLIVQFGVGLEGVDIPSASDLGIAVARIPSASTGNAASCAEHCIYLLLGLLRQQHAMEASVRSRKLGQPLGQTLQGRTVLISGYGAIGKELAVRLQPFGVRIIGVRRSWDGVMATEGGDHESTRLHVPYPLHVAAGLDSLSKLLPEADAVVLCNQLSDETRGMVNAPFLAACKKGVHIINIARGGLIDYSSVKASLEQGHVGGLGLDVTWHEPFDPTDSILQHHNVIVTPHVGGVTDVSYQTMAQIINDTVVHLRMGSPLTLVEVVNHKELGIATVTTPEAL